MQPWIFTLKKLTPDVIIFNQGQQLSPTFNMTSQKKQTNKQTKKTSNTHWRHAIILGQNFDLSNF